MLERLRLKPLCSGWRRALAVVAVALLGAPVAEAQVDAYTLTPSTGTFVPVTGGTNVADIEEDDEISASLPLGFSFLFDGVAYTQVRASSNGWLTFNATTSLNNRFNELSAAPTSIRPLVAPLWDDLDGDAGTASYITTGTAPNRVFTMQWLNWKWNYTAAAPGISFQVKLYEGTNRVEFIYRPEAGALDNPSASIGLAGATAGSFLSLNGTSASPTVSSTAETNTISAKPAAGQTYSFLPPVVTGCSVPRGLAATSVGLTTATLNWTAASGNGTFTVEYGPNGFAPGTGAPGAVTRTGIASTSLSLTGLSPLQTYQFYVTQNCGGALGNSGRSNAGTFTTINDDCSSAVPLAVTTGNICTTRTVFTLTGATGSTSAPTPSCASYQGGDVWFSVVVPANGALTFQLDSVGGSSITDTGMEIYSGTCTSLTAIECDDDDGNDLFSFIDRTGLTPGSTIYVRVWQYNNSTPVGRVAICVRSINPPPPPTNDECATAITVNTTPTCGNPTSGYVTGATQSQPAGCGSVSQANDVWYRFTAIGTAQNILLTPQFPAAMDVLRGSCGALTSVSCATVATGNGTPRTLTGLIVGQTYYIRVFSTAASVPVSQAVFNLCVQPAPGSCATPTAPMASAITSAGATLSWAGTLGSGETFTVQYGLRNSTNLTSISNLTTTSTNLTNLLPNTEYCFYVSKSCGPLLGVSAPTAETCFRTLIAVPGNDEPCGAVALTVTATGQVAQVSSTNSGATTSTQTGIVLPACSPALSPKDVWFRVTMPAGQTALTIGMTGNPGGMIRLFTASNCSTAMTQVDCRAATAANTSVGTQAFTGLTAGTTYYVAVSGYGSNDTQGNFSIGSAVTGSRAARNGAELTVFPNPVHDGALTLRLSGAGAAPAGQAVLINALGQVVRTQAVSIHNGAAEQQLSVEGLSRGLYTLRLQVAGTTVTRPVAVE